MQGTSLILGYLRHLQNTTAFVKLISVSCYFDHHDNQDYRPDKNKEHFASTVFQDKGEN